MTTNSGPGQGPTYPGLSVIMGERRQLINLTYRLLGSLAEAEDAVQETYARWYSMSRQKQDAIESPGAWLTTVATASASTCSARHARGGNATWANGSLSRCPSLRSGPAGSRGSEPGEMPDPSRRRDLESVTGSSGALSSRKSSKRKERS